MKTPKLTVLEKIGFGGGDAAVNVVWSSLAIIITFFYTDVFKLNVAHIAMLGLLPRLIDAFADVAMGVYTDSHTTRWGRYRPYFLIFAVPFGIAVMLVFTTPELSYSGKLIWAYATYILMMLVFTAIVIPYISLPGVLTADPQERLSANGYRLFFAKVPRCWSTRSSRSSRPSGAGTHCQGLPGFDGGDGRFGHVAVHLLLLHHDRTGEVHEATESRWGSRSAALQERPMAWFCSGSA
jgi:hypothetical protein